MSAFELSLWVGGALILASLAISAVLGRGVLRASRRLTRSAWKNDLRADLAARLAARWGWQGTTLATKVQLALDGLEDYFRLHMNHPHAGDLGMPSVLVDEAWHLFLEHPSYESFCKDVFGYTLVHTPHAAAKPGPLSPDFPFSDDVRRTARLSAQEQRGRLKAHQRTVPLLRLPLPRLFAADAGVEGGWGWTTQAYASAVHGGAEGMSLPSAPALSRTPTSRRRAASASASSSMAPSSSTGSSCGSTCSGMAHAVGSGALPGRL